MGLPLVARTRLRDLLVAAIWTLLLSGMCAAATWDGPTAGPVAISGKQIVFIAQDFRNGGVTALFRQFQKAALCLRWHVDIVDGSGKRETIRRAFLEAMKVRPDGVVLGGFNEEEISDLVPPHCQAVLIGWHASAYPGPTEHLFVNITTNPSVVADMATAYLIRQIRSPAGIVIFNDDRFQIAQVKTRRMKDDLRACSLCQLLEVDNLSISSASDTVPAEVGRLNSEFGKRWTHSLAINDAYFDAINAPLAALGRHDILNVSAGDGAFKALSRIRSGASQQIATIAEPVGIQGWQLADEFNRAFAGAPPSGYVSSPILATTSSLQSIEYLDIDGGVPYRQAYSRIWRVPPAPH